MTANERRQKITAYLKGSISPVTATALAAKFSVSRQIIVGDIAILRASGVDISATPRGYTMEAAAAAGIYCEKTIACRHDFQGLKTELYTIVDNGAQAINVTVEHSVYGQISAPLHLFSRFDVDQFLAKLEHSSAKPLCDLTDGIHLHKIRCPDADAADRILQQLTDAGILVSQ